MAINWRAPTIPRIPSSKHPKKGVHKLIRPIKTALFILFSEYTIIIGNMTHADITQEPNWFMQWTVVAPPSEVKELNDNQSAIRLYLAESDIDKSESLIGSLYMAAKLDDIIHWWTFLLKFPLVNVNAYCKFMMRQFRVI